MNEIDQGEPELERIQTDAELIQLIFATLHSANEKERDAAKQRLISNLYPQLVTRLIELIVNPATDHGIKQEIVRIMERFIDEIIERSFGSSSNIRLLFDYILSGIDPKSKGLLQKIFVELLEYSFFEDLAYLHQQFEARTKTIAASLEEFDQLESFIFMIQQLKDDRGWTQELSNSLKNILNAFPKWAAKIFKKDGELPPQQLMQSKKVISSKLEKLLQLFHYLVEYATQRVEYESQSFNDYLLLFSRNGSIISHLPPCPLSEPSENSLLKCTSEVCEIVFCIKDKILEAVLSTFRNVTAACPLSIIDIMLKTLLMQNRPIENSYIQSLIVNCLKIIILNPEEFIEIISPKSRKGKMLSTLFLLFTSSDTEINKIQADPQGFVKQTDACLQTSLSLQTCNKLKPAVLCFLKSYIEYADIDGLKANIIGDILALLTDSLHPKNAESMTNNQKSSISGYYCSAFYNLSQEKKIESLLLLIAALYRVEQIDDQKMIQKINYFIEANFDLFAYSHSQIVTLRFFRMLSFFYSPGRFENIQMQMSRGKAFMLEGIKVFVRYVRINKNEFNLIIFLLSNFEQIIDIIQISNNWYTFLVNQLHEEILLGNYETNMALIRKIRRQFKEESPFNSYIKGSCIDILQVLLLKETDKIIFSLLLETFYEFYDSISVEKNHIQYEQKIMEICMNIIQKCQTFSTHIQQLAIKSLASLRNISNISNKIFRFYNIYFTKLPSQSDQIFTFYSIFLQEIKYRLPPSKPLKNVSNFQIVINYAFLISQMIVIRPDVCLRGDGLLPLFYLAKYAPKAHKQCMLGIILTYACIQPEKFAHFLNENHICKIYLRSMLRIDMNEKIFIKIFNLACLKLLTVDEDSIFSEKVSAKFIHNSKELAFKANPRGKDGRGKTQSLSFLRSKRTLKQKQVNHNDHFPEFKHPLQEINELEELKYLYSTNNRLVQRKLREKQARELRLILKAGAYVQGIEQIYEEEIEE